MGFRTSASSILLGAVAMLAGCVHESWQPPPPQGQTYEYDYQGFRSSSTTVIAGGGQGLNYGGAFNIRRRRDVREYEPGKDPFAQSAVIDGVHFNAHLGGQGERLEPNTAVPVAPAPSATPKSNNRGER